VAVLLQACSNSVTLRKFSNDRPTNLFVAGFIGSPAMNLFEGSLNSELTGVALGSQHIGLSSDVVTLHPGLRRFAGQPIVVGVRPEDLRAPSDDRPGAAFVGEVEVVERSARNS